MAHNSVVHIWTVNPNHLAPDLLGRCMGIVSPEEKARFESLRVERVRREYLITRILVRMVLSRYAPVDPQDWRFSKTEHGQPRIASPEKFTSSRFSVSHTNGLIACAASPGQDIGIDVEDTTRDFSDVTGFFSQVERQDMDSRPLEERRSKFFEIWTLKEAYTKARGMGFSLPIHAFSFQVDGSGEIRAFLAGTGDDEKQWRFALFQPTVTHRMAVALHRGNSAQDSVTFQIAQFDFSQI